MIKECLKVKCKSLKELSSRLVTSKKIVDPRGNHLARFLELWSIVFTWSVKLNAVTAIVTVRDSGNLVKRLISLHLCGPLPGIFNTICEKDVSRLDVPATLVDSGLLGRRLNCHTLAERASAHLVPVFVFEHRGSHDVLLAWHLEPTVLGAVLEGPWTCRAVDIYGSVSDDPRVIVTWVHPSDIMAKVGHKLHDGILSGSGIVGQKITHLGSVAILDRLQEDVCIEEHPVISAHTLRARTLESLVDDSILITSFTQVSLLRHILHRLLDGRGAGLTTLEGGCIGLLIELPEVDNRLNDT